MFSMCINILQISLFQLYIKLNKEIKKISKWNKDNDLKDKLCYKNKRNIFDFKWIKIFAKHVYEFSSKMKMKKKDDMLENKNNSCGQKRHAYSIGIYIRL